MRKEPFVSDGYKTLKEGDSVVLVGQHELSDGAKVTVATAAGAEK